VDTSRVLFLSTLEIKAMEPPELSVSINNRTKSSLQEKLEYVKERRRRIEPFCDPLLVDYDPDLAKLKMEMDRQVQDLYVKIHNQDYASFSKSIDFILEVEE
jgi:hypothetical protein